MPLLTAVVLQIPYSIGDDNTAIRFPAADTFSVETGGNEALEIDSSQRINIGGAAVSQTRTVNIGSNAEANLAIETHNDATSETANIRFYKSGNTAASPQIVETDDNIAQLIFYGHDGTDYANAAAAIKASVDGTPGSNDMPGMLQFHTNAGGTSAAERLRIGSSGQIGLGGANYGTSGQVLTSNGSGSAPTWQDSSGGGAGGISTTHQQVQSTTATGISTFSTTEYRSAHMLVGITQGTSYQTGRYLIIHDNTTPTILEESSSRNG